MASPDSLSTTWSQTETLVETLRPHVQVVSAQPLPATYPGHLPGRLPLPAPNPPPNLTPRTRAKPVSLAIAANSMQSYIAAVP